MPDNLQLDLSKHSLQIFSTTKFYRKSQPGFKKQILIIKNKVYPIGTFLIFDHIYNALSGKIFI